MSHESLPFVHETLTPASWRTLALAAVSSDPGVTLVLTVLNNDGTSQGGIAVITHIPSSREGQANALHVVRSVFFGHTPVESVRVAYAFVASVDSEKTILRSIFNEVWRVEGAG